MSWFFLGRVFEDKDIPPGAVGFVYMMEAVIDGHMYKYIGKKNFFSNKKKALTKKDLSSDKRKKKYTRVIKPDYHNYYSSNEVLKKAHKDGVHIQRIILRICYDKKDLSYREVQLQFEYKVLEDQRFLNGNILGRFYKQKS